MMTFNRMGNKDVPYSSLLHKLLKESNSMQTIKNVRTVYLDELMQPLYPPDWAASDCNLFRSLEHVLSVRAIKKIDFTSNFSAFLLNRKECDFFDIKWKKKKDLRYDTLIARSIDFGIRNLHPSYRFENTILISK